MASGIVSSNQLRTRIRAKRTCSKISMAPRFLTNPIRPVAQNLQPTAHPTWVETHTVARFFRERITTVSQASCHRCDRSRSLVTRLSTDVCSASVDQHHPASIISLPSFASTRLIDAGRMPCLSSRQRSLRQTSSDETANSFGQIRVNRLSLTTSDGIGSGSLIGVLTQTSGTKLEGIVRMYERPFFHLCKSL